jgi:hypothetical protein
MQKIITLDEFKQKKDIILSKKIRRVQTNWSAVKIISESACRVGNEMFALDKHAFKSILKLVGVTNTVRKNLMSSYGSMFTDKLIDTMKSGIGKKKGGEITLLIDENKRRIINIIGGGMKEMIPNSNYLNTVEKIIDGSNLEISNIYVKPDGGFSISTIAPSSEWGLKGSPNEHFKFGLNFKNDPINGTSANPFNMRLVCTNGMIGENEFHSIEMIGEKDSINNYFAQINSLKKNGWKPFDFAPTLNRMVNGGTKASVSELVGIRNLVKANSSIDDMQLEKFIPIEFTENAYTKKGMPFEMMSKKQKINATTDVNYWDMLNGLTDLASHNYGFNMRNSDKLQVAAGNLFVKTPDLDNLVTSPFE